MSAVRSTGMGRRPCCCPRRCYFTTAVLFLWEWPFCYSVYSGRRATRIDNPPGITLRSLLVEVLVITLDRSAAFGSLYVRLTRPARPEYFNGD